MQLGLKRFMKSDIQRELDSSILLVSGERRRTGISSAIFYSPLFGINITSFNHIRAGPAQAIGDSYIITSYYTRMCS